MDADHPRAYGGLVCRHRYIGMLAEQHTPTEQLDDLLLR